MDKTTQNQIILEALQNGFKLTALDALEMARCFRLSARVYDLRRQGFPIRTKRIAWGKKYIAEYSLENAHE